MGVLDEAGGAGVSIVCGRDLTAGGVRCSGRSPR